MSILNDVVNSGSQAPVSNNRGGEERKKSMFWVNVGVTIPGGGKDGEDLFVSLPFGIPLDDMRYAEASGNSADYAKLIQAKNALLDLARKQGSQLEPGGNMQLEGWTVKLQRKAEQSSTSTKQDNDLIAQLFGALGV